MIWYVATLIASVFSTRGTAAQGELKCNISDLCICLHARSALLHKRKSYGMFSLFLLPTGGGPGHKTAGLFHLPPPPLLNILPSCESSATVKRFQGCLRPAGAMIREEWIVHVCAYVCLRARAYVCVCVMLGKTDREAWIDGRMRALGPCCQICAFERARACVCWEGGGGK